MICRDCPHCWPVIDILRKKPVMHWCDLTTDNVNPTAECICPDKRLIFEQGKGDSE